MSAFAIMQFNTQKTEIYYLEQGLDPFTGEPPEKPAPAGEDETVLANGAGSTNGVNGIPYNLPAPDDGRQA